MTDPARYRLPGRRGWWRDLFTLLGIATLCEMLTDLFGINGWWTLALVMFIGIPLAAALGVLSERPRVEDDW